MWADTLLAAERAHLMWLALWGGMSMLTGAALLALLRLQRGSSQSHSRAPLLVHFAAQGLAWGALELAFAALALRRLALRDLAGATQLARQLWLKAGIEAGAVAVGVTLVIVGWRFAARSTGGVSGAPGRSSTTPPSAQVPELGAVGAGIGIVVQAAVLLAMDLYFLSRIMV